MDARSQSRQLSWLRFCRYLSWTGRRLEDRLIVAQIVLQQVDRMVDVMATRQSPTLVSMRVSRFQPDRIEAESE